MTLPSRSMRFYFLVLWTLFCSLAPFANVYAQAEPLSPSFYELKTSLTKQDNQKIRVDTYRGYPVIVSMVYSTCPYTCPMIITKLQKIESAMPETLRSKLRVLLISIDPEHDTPETMNKALLTHKVDTSRWTFAVASTAETRDIAAILGVKYRAAQDGNVNHDAIFTVLDAEGRIRSRFEGLKFQDTEIIEAISTITQSTQSSPANP